MITIIQQKRIDKKILTRIRRYTAKILKFLSIGEKSVSIILCDEQVITDINKRYFNKTEPTNVISFPFHEENYLGEIYVCIPVAEREAKEWEVSFFYEIIYLIIHGILHLIGYDHVKSESEAAVMEEKERETVAFLNMDKWRNNDTEN